MNLVGKIDLVVEIAIVSTTPKLDFLQLGFT